MNLLESDDGVKQRSRYGSALFKISSTGAYISFRRVKTTSNQNTFENAIPKEKHVPSFNPSICVTVTILTLYNQVFKLQRNSR